MLSYNQRNIPVVITETFHSAVQDGTPYDVTLCKFDVLQQHVDVFTTQGSVK